MNLILRHSANTPQRIWYLLYTCLATSFRIIQIASSLAIKLSMHMQRHIQTFKHCDSMNVLEQDKITKRDFFKGNVSNPDTFTILPTCSGKVNMVPQWLRFYRLQFYIYRVQFYEFNPSITNLSPMGSWPKPLTLSSPVVSCLNHNQLWIKAAVKWGNANMWKLGGWLASAIIKLPLLENVGSSWLHNTRNTRLRSVV